MIKSVDMWNWHLGCWKCYILLATGDEYSVFGVQLELICMADIMWGAEQFRLLVEENYLV